MAHIVTHSQGVLMPQYKVKHAIGLFCFLFTLLTNSSGLMAKCNKELVNGWAGEWEPFITGAYDKPAGLDMEVLNAVIRASGCTWKNTNLVIPWARHLGLIKLGELDLATAATWTKERAEYAYFTQPYRRESVAIFVRKSDLEKYVQYSLETLFDKLHTIGVERGNSYGTVMDELLAAFDQQVEKVNDNKQNVSKLMNKRVDGYLGLLPYDSIQVKNMGFEDMIVPLPLSIVNTGDIHIMLSKEANSKEIFQALESGLFEIKNNGTYDAIITKYSEKYGVSYW